MNLGRAASLLGAIWLLAGCDNEAPPAGVVISNVRIVDGSGAAAYPGSVRVVNGLIDAVGDVRPGEADTVFDGGGLILAPGFIDTHSHADAELLEQPDALAAVSQGITTVVIGQDGGSPYPLSGFAEQLASSGSAVNVASYVGHNTLRQTVLRDDYAREATTQEIDTMRSLLGQELAAGALGLSTGLEYEPGIYSSTDEVLALALEAASVGGRYISHMRSEDRALDAAIDELLLIGSETGMPVQISHMKLAARSLWGRADGILAKLDEARRNGIDVTADVYPYEYWQSTMMVLLPDRDPSDRDAVSFALRELAPPEGIWFTRYAPNTDYVGMTLAEIASLRETDAVTAFQELAQAALEYARDTGQRAEQIIGTSMSGGDIDALLRWPHSNICSDGSLADGHPRGAGAFPRVLGRYVRERGVLPLELALHKMTGLAAAHMGFADRGILREGYVADLVLFDPDTVIDNATAEQPGELATGVARVWVAGRPVFEEGAATGARPGEFLRRDGWGN